MNATKEKFYENVRAGNRKDTVGCVAVLLSIALTVLAGALVDAPAISLAFAHNSIEETKNA